MQITIYPPKKILKYTPKEIFEELNHLEKQVSDYSTINFEMHERTKDIINYYMDNRREYDDLMIEKSLEEIGFELLLRTAFKSPFPTS